MIALLRSTKIGRCRVSNTAWLAWAEKPSTSPHGARIFAAEGVPNGNHGLYVLQCEALLQRRQFARTNAAIAEAFETVHRTEEQLFEAEFV